MRVFKQHKRFPGGPYANGNSVLFFIFSCLFMLNACSNHSFQANTFDPNTLPPTAAGNWQSNDVGKVYVTGSSEADNTQVTLKGSGSDIWGRYDKFHFYSTDAIGDSGLIARVDSLENTHPYAKAGLMFRASLDTKSPNVRLVVTPERGIAMQ